MSNYTRITNYASKDALVSGNPAKVIKGTEIGADLDAVSVAVATKSDLASPTFTGTVTVDNITATGTVNLGTVDGGTY
jgi:hypothetical protein